MAPHSSTLAWKIPWIEEPGRLQSMGLLRVRHDWVMSDFTFTFHFHALKKERATHSSVLAWSIPGTGEPGGLPSMGSHRVGHDWSDLAVADVFLKLSCFFDDPIDVGNLISGSSAFSKSSLNIWKFTVHILLKPDLENFKHYFAGIWDECNCSIVWTFFGIEMKTDLFQSCDHCWVFQICRHIECSTFTASSCRIWNSSAGIPSPSQALFIVILPEFTWLWTPDCLALDEWSHHRGYLGH